VRLVASPTAAAPDETAAYIGLDAHPLAAEFGWHRAFASIDDYARGFYEALREVDRRGLRSVICQRVPAQGTGIALSDRLERAAEE
jgi:hypothetical protein